MDTQIDNTISFYRGLLDIMPDMMFVKDVAGRFIECNRVFVAYMGATSVADVIGKTDADFYPAQLAERFARDDAYVMSLPEGQAYDFEQDDPAPDGTMRYLRMKKVRVTGADGAPCLLGLAVDQTELRVALDRAVKAESAKSYFFSTVSHDIRTPLNAIVGFSQLLKVGIRDETERQKALSALVASANMLQKLVGDVLDLSKLDAGKLELVTETTDCERIVREIAATYAGVVKIKGLKFVSDVKVRPLLEIDARRLRQIIFNLVGNAVKFTDKGRVSLSVVFDEEKRELTITVADTGCGISPEDQQRIADPYVEAGKNGRHGGTGLGLAVVKRLVFRMNGDMMMKSALGVGSTFTVVIPDVPVSSAARKREYTLTQRIKVAVGSKKDRASTYALVVDDSKINVLVLRSMLVKLGYTRIATASNGREALEKLATNPKIRLVLTDVWMPEMNGLQLAKAIQGNPRLRHVKVYAITADTEVRNDYAETGFLDVLMKPVTLDALGKVL